MATELAIPICFINLEKKFSTDTEETHSTKYILKVLRSLLVKKNVVFFLVTKLSNLTKL